MMQSRQLPALMVDDILLALCVMPCYRDKSGLHGNISHLSNHGFVLSLKGEDIVVQLTPWLSQGSVNMTHDMLQPFVKSLLRPCLFVEVASAIFRAIHVASL